MIISGKCTKCGREFWHSFGHPKWMDDKESENYKAFCDIKKSGACMKCIMDGSVEIDRKD